jgi:hypothetical protein
MLGAKAAAHVAHRSAVCYRAGLLLALDTTLLAAARQPDAPLRLSQQQAWAACSAALSSAVEIEAQLLGAVMKHPIIFEVELSSITTCRISNEHGYDVPSRC